MSAPRARHTPTKPRVPKVVPAVGSAINTVRQSASRGGASSAASSSAPPAGGSRAAHRGTATGTPAVTTQQQQQPQEAFKQSRAAALKLEISGTQKMRQIVELLFDPATNTQYRQHVAGVNECLQCFPDGFTPSIAQDGVGQLVAGMTQVVATLAAGSEALIPALLAVINKCAAPIACVTLEDQHNAEGGIRALCVALCSALTAPMKEVRIAAAVGLHKVFASIRALAGDDLMSDSEKRDKGEIAAWKVNVRRSVTLEVLQALCACWSDTLDEEVERLKVLAQQVAAADAAAEVDKQESDDDRDAASSKQRQASRTDKRRMSSADADSRPSTTLTNNNAIANATGNNMLQLMQMNTSALNVSTATTTTTPATRALIAKTVRELDDNTKRVARVKNDSGVDLTEMVAILKAVREISAFAPQCAHLVIDCDVCRLLVGTMSVCERGDRRVAIAVEVLWNLLDLCPEAASHCCNIETIEALYQAFVECLSIGYKLKERELRNDLIVVVTAISEAPEAAEFLGPFAEILLELSCGNEKHRGRSESPFINPKNHFTLSNEDQQAKVLSWGFLARLCRQSVATAAKLALEGDSAADDVVTAATTILDWGFVNVLISYLDVHCEDPAVVRWSTPQLLDLQEQALLILTQIAEIGWEYFLHCDAPTILHSYIAECPDVQLRNLALTLIARLAVTDAKVAVADSGAVPVAVQLLMESDDDALALECLNLLADIVNREPQQQLLFLSCGGVQSVLPRLVFSPTYHTTRREDVVLSAFDCCWSCIFGNVECERAFIKAGGVSACLLALETIRFESAPFILSALADLFTNREAIPEVRSWRSPKTGRSGVQLFIELWRKASAGADSGTMHMASGANTSATPFHKDPNMSGLGGHSAHGQNAAAADEDAHATGIVSALTSPRLKRLGQGEVSEAAAAMTKAQGTHIKIYACMCCVGFADHRELKPGERATLSHMEVFEHLCNDLAWAAVNASLTEERITPIASDRAKLDGVLAEGAARKVALDTIQDLYRKEEQQRVVDRENAFYKTIIKKTDEELPPGVVTCGMTITQAKICKSQMLKESVQQAQAHQHAKAVEKARSIGINGGNNAEDSKVGPSSSNALSAPLTFSIKQQSTKENVSRTPSPATERGGGEGQKAMTEEEYAVLKLMNTVRTDPESFIPILEARAAEVADLVKTHGHAEAQGITEGVAAVEEAISVLQSARRIVTYLDVPMGMLFATRDHAADIRTRMDVSPNSHDGATPLQRLMRYGTVPQKSILIQVVGKKTPEEVITQLLVDDGIASRVDRRNILDPEMRCASVSIAPHPFHHSVVIIAMAHEYTDKPREQQHDVNRKVHAKMKSSVK